MNNNRPFRGSITTHCKHHDRGKRFHTETAVYTHLQHGRPLARQPVPLDMPTSHPSPPALHQRPRHAPCPYQRRNRLHCLQGTIWSWTSATADVQIVSLVPCWRQAAPPACKQPCKSRHFMRQEKKKKKKEENCVRVTPRLTIVSLNRQEGNSSRRQPHSLASYRAAISPLINIEQGHLDSAPTTLIYPPSFY